MHPGIVPVEELPRVFARVKRARPLSDEEIISLNRPDSASGPGKLGRKAAAKFAKHEKSRAVDESWKSEVRIPRWFVALSQKHARPAQILHEAARRLRLKVDRKGLRTTQMIVNEIGRRKGGPGVSVRRIPRKLVNGFLAKKR